MQTQIVNVAGVLITRHTPNHTNTAGPRNGYPPMADANEPLVYETIETPAPAPAKGFDFIQLGFWAALVVAGGAAGMALTWSDAVGPAGAVLVIALGAMALVLILWAVRGAGRKLGVFPERGAAEAAAQATKRHVWLEALTEPALISDRGGASVAANAAYLELAQLAHEVGDSAHAPSVDRLFSSNPGMAAPIYRLSKAAKAGIARTELLPALLFGDSVTPTQYEASVAPLGNTRSLWRLRKVEAAASASRADRSIRARSMLKMRRSASSRRAAMAASSISTRRCARCWACPMARTRCGSKTSCAPKA